MFDRLISLIGKENLKLVSSKKILLVGLGGVGGYTLEALVRSGFLNITIVDKDTIDITNLNRQILANTKNIGNYKVDEAKKRCLAINNKVKIKTINECLDSNNLDDFLVDKYDYIVDATDDTNLKVALIRYAKNNNIKIITCLGTGKKINANDLEMTLLSKTYNDPLAKKMRNLLKKENIALDIPVVFSKEIAIKSNKGEIASAVFVPACAGFYLANYVFNDIIDMS